MSLLTIRSSGNIPQILQLAELQYTGQLILYSFTDRQVPNAAENMTKKTVQLDASTVEIEERGVKLRLTVVDTPGFGDAIDNTDSFQQIIRYIDDQFER